MTDSRFGGYVTKYGRQSWELDALNPDVMGKLIEKAIKKCITDAPAYKAAQSMEARGRKLTEAGDNWTDIAEALHEFRNQSKHL